MKASWSHNRHAIGVMALAAAALLSLLSTMETGTFARWYERARFIGGQVEAGHFDLDLVSESVWAVCSPAAETAPDGAHNDGAQNDGVTVPDDAATTTAALELAITDAPPTNCTLIDPLNVYVAPDETLVFLTEWEVLLSGENSYALFELPNDFVAAVDDLVPETNPAISVFVSPLQSLILDAEQWNALLADESFAAAKLIASQTDEAPNSIWVSALTDTEANPVSQYYLSLIVFEPNYLQPTGVEGVTLSVTGVNAKLGQGRTIEVTP